MAEVAIPITADDADASLRKRLGMRVANDLGSSITAADQAGGDVGYGTVLGSGISGAAAGAEIGSVVPGVGTGIRAAAGAVVGIGTGLLAKYNSDKAKRAIARERSRRELMLFKQQREWMAKNAPKLALQDKVDMAKLSSQFDEETRNAQMARSTAGLARMDNMATAINKSRQPSLDAVGGLY